MDCGACGNGYDEEYQSHSEKLVPVIQIMADLSNIDVDTEYLNPPQPLCSECFSGWLLNFLKVED